MLERFRQQVSLAEFTTMGVGGPARWFYECENPTELPEIIETLRGEALPLAVLGGGSNLLYPDAGFPGLVLKIAWKGVTMNPSTADGDSVTVRAAAGEVWDDFVLRCIDGNLAGIECLSGIPGLVGAVPIQNVGAYGQEVAETITRVAVFDLRDMKAREFSPEECDFGYRRSRFKYADRGRFIVLEADFRLRRGGEPSLRYKELINRMETRDEQGEARESGPERLLAVRKAVLELRADKGMVIDPGDPDSRSCGSFFMNPFIAHEQYTRFREFCAAAGMDPENAPAFAQGDGPNPPRKLSAAWLVENAGFHKGFARGEAGVSGKHSLAVINRGRARTEEILAFAAEIRAGVLEKFGIELEREPVYEDGLAS